MRQGPLWMRRSLPLILPLILSLGSAFFWSGCEPSEPARGTVDEGDAYGGGAYGGEPVAGQGLEGGGMAGQVSGGVTPAPEPYLELGTGFRRFEPVMNGQEVPIIEGIQGGYHVWGALRGRGFTATDISLLFELSLDGEVIASADYFEYELPVDRSGDYVYPGVSVIYFENERVGPSSGREMTLLLTLSTSDGETLTDQVTLRPVCCE